MDPTDKAKEQFSDGDAPQRPGWWKALKAWWQSEGDSADPARRDVLETANESLPDFVGGRKAVKKNRARLAEIDAIRD
jgi:hypothetical protein